MRRVKTADKAAKRKGFDRKSMMDGNGMVNVITCGFREKVNVIAESKVACNVLILKFLY